MSQKQHLFILFGTRPEAIKLAPLILLAKKNPLVQLTVCSSGQHREMIQPVLNFFGIQLDYDLDVMSQAKNLNELAAAIISGLGHCLMNLKKMNEGPHWLIVQGDTTTSAAASLVAFYEKIPLVHVEAGLRTETLLSPWPEEYNRRLITLSARVHFAPTDLARTNLLAERIPSQDIVQTGNTGIDALMNVIEKLKNPLIVQDISQRYDMLNEGKKLILATLHRRENFGDPLDDVLQALVNLSQRDDVQILLPVHLNPVVREQVQKTIGQHGVWLKNFDPLSDVQRKIILCDPLDYFDFVYLMQKSHFIISDSGGVQEEAPSLGKPVLVVRESTERPEAVEAGANQLVGTQTDRIENMAVKLLQDFHVYQKMAQIRHVYGDGRACEKILAHLLERGM